MSKPRYFMKLIPPRPTFAQDMTAAERELMTQHVAYVRGYFERGSVLLYGPVLDPEGSFGIAVLEMEEAEMKEFVAGDPTISAGLNTFSVAPMRLGGCQAPRD